MSSVTGSGGTDGVGGAMAKPAYYSKINGASLAALVGNLIVLFGIDLDAERKVALLSLINMAGFPLIMGFRTWATETRLYFKKQKKAEK